MVTYSLRNIVYVITLRFRLYYNHYMLCSCSVVATEFGSLVTLDLRLDN